jgi:hypothetical protein
MTLNNYYAKIRINPLIRRSLYMLAPNVLPVDKVGRGYRHTPWLYCNLYKFKNLPLNQQTEPFYLPAVIGRWSAGREWALANAFMDSFCKFFKTKADGYLQVQSVSRGFIF